jgi:transcriptional regulator with XRE-family HTH domain
MATFGQRLKQIRLENNITAKDLAKEMSITQRAFNYYENDEREPNLKNIRFICERFNVSADWLLGLDD